MRTGNMIHDGKWVGLPKVTTAEMNAISGPFAGMEVWNTTDLSLYAYSGSAWVAVGGAKMGVQTMDLANVNNYQSVSQLIWETAFVPPRGGVVDTIQIYAYQAGTGNTRVGLYDSSDNLIVQSGNYGNIFQGLNTFTLSSSTTLVAGTKYFVGIQSRANGASLLYFGAYSANAPAQIARIDPNNGPDPGSGMVGSMSSYSTTGEAMWANIYKA